METLHAETCEEKDILRLISENHTGLSITEIVRAAQIPRCAVRMNLAKLEGAQAVKVRKIGMAKVYILNRLNKNTEHTGHNEDMRAIQSQKPDSRVIEDNTLMH